MDSIIAATADERVPLLDSARSPPTPAPSRYEILPQPPPPPLPPPAAEDEDYSKRAPSGPNNRRLASLNVFRGLAVALMILVDDAGGEFPSINHAPWTGVTIADFVMPFFLFVVGVSVALVFKEPSNKLAATRKVAARTLKLFILGVLLQGGYFHGRSDLIYGVDIDRIRWLGVLQRIAIGYFLSAVSEIWLVNDLLVDSPATFMKKYCIEWMVAILLCASYIGLLYGLYVPDWNFEASSGSTSLLLSEGAEFKTVHCGLRGSLSPPCNAVGLIDRLFLGERHLYQQPVYRRTKGCSTNSPGYGPLPPNAPEWCLAPFDPEGILSSMMAVVTCFLGMHFGHFIVHLKNLMKRMLLWVVTSLLLLIAGYAVAAIGMPLSKPLYTVSYMLVAAGFSGLLLTLIYLIVDVKHFRRPTILFQWMGMNAFIVYALAACEVFPAAIQGFYWHDPANNLREKFANTNCITFFIEYGIACSGLICFTVDLRKMNVIESTLQTVLHSKRWGTMAFVLLEMIFWCLFAGFLNKKGIYVKL